MKKLIFKIIFAFIILPAAITATLFQLNKSGFFNVTSVNIIFENEIEGQKKFLAPLALELEKNMSEYKGVSLWKLPLQKISKELSAYNWIEVSAVKRSWPSTLVIQVKPYEVKLLYVGKNGKLLPVIKNGEFLSPVESMQAPDVALLDGDVFIKKPELRKKAVQVIDDIPAEGSFSKKTISEIRYDKQDGFWMTLVKTGIQVKIGEDKVSLKSARVSQVVEYLDSRQFDARVIDANLSKKVLVRLRKEP